LLHGKTTNHHPGVPAISAKLDQDECFSALVPVSDTRTHLCPQSDAFGGPKHVYRY
jgi:hypothetical protein